MDDIVWAKATVERTETSIKGFHQHCIDTKMHSERMRLDCNDIMEKAFKAIKKTSNVKIYRLCDSIVKEFEYLN